MRGILRELLQAFVVLIALFLVLDKSTGFSRNLGALGDFVRKSGRTFQGH